MTAGEKILEIEDLRVHFPVRGGIFRRAVGACKAVDGVTLFLRKGQTLGLVGESGCGKSTLAKAVVKLLEPTSGTIRFGNKEGIAGESETNFRKSVQMVFQDPAESLNSRMTVGTIIGEPLDIHQVGDPKERRNRVIQLLKQVGLPENAIKLYPFEFSGGQRQRIGIARALALNPELLVLDEPVSALDVSIQAQIINLMMDLQEEFNLSIIFIAHDLSVVKHISDRIGVMYNGELVEINKTDDIFDKPSHDYTRELLRAIPQPNPIGREERKKERLSVK